MSITVVTAAPDHLLTTLSAVKRALNIPETTVNKDELLAELIQAASQQIYTYCGRTFAKEKITEDLAGKDLPNILLDRTPIVSVSEVLLDEQEFEDYSILDKEAGILQRKDGFTTTNLPWQTISPHPSPYYEKRWHVTYIGGYNLPNWTGSDLIVGSGTYSRNLPYDLERACIEMIRVGYNRSGGGILTDPSISSYKIGETMVSFKGTGGASSEDASGVFGMPMSIMGILNYYRRAF